MMGQKVNYNGTTITLWEAYDETGKLKTGVEWSENDRFNFMQKLHKMNKELHGVYNNIYIMFLYPFSIPTYLTPQLKSA